MVSKRLLNTAILIGFILALLPVAGVFAQCEGDCEPPLIFESDGVILVCNPETGDRVSLGDSPLNDGAALSPDGLYIAFRTEADGVSDAIANEIVFLPAQRPSNIWLWEIGTEEPILIAGQPEDAVITSELGFQHMIERSVPVWSPDSTQLAWGSFDLDAWSYQIMVYNLEDETIEVMIENPPSGFQDVVFYPHPPSWGAGGIVFVQPTFVETDDSSPGFRDMLTLFDPEDGSQILNEVVTDADNPYVLDWMWLDESTIALQISDDQWKALNVETGEQTEIDSPIPSTDEMMDYGECEDIAVVG